MPHQRTSASVVGVDAFAALVNCDKLRSEQSTGILGPAFLTYSWAFSRFP